MKLACGVITDGENALAILQQHELLWPMIKE